jgi:hypothetical protein
MEKENNKSYLEPDDEGYITAMQHAEMILNDYVPGITHKK